MRLSAFETYSLYLALKNHFNSSYDFFKYHGKTNASKESFINRKDRFQFQRLSRMYDSSEMQEFLVANFLAGRKWVGEMLEDDAADTFKAYQKRKQSMSYVFANELDQLFSKESPTNAFKVSNGSIPPILNFVMSGSISPETFVILDRFIGFSKVYDKTLSEDFLWSRYNKLPQKLHPFLQYDKERMKTILKDKINEYK